VKVDLEALRDLEIVPGPSAPASVIDCLDRTSTRGGRDALARRLRSPLGALGEIQEVQAALRFIIDFGDR
jgi:DNA mismatch repair ATPase MutS